MPFSFTSTGSGTPGPKGDPGPAVDTYDKIYVTNNGGGTNVKVGDDAWIGDVNIGNTISIKGVQDATKGGIVLGSGLSEIISTNGTDLSLTAENDIILNPGSNYGYIGAPHVDGGNRIATWDDIAAKKYGASASYWSTQTQGPYTANSIHAMTLNNTDWQTGVTLQNNSQIKMNQAGKYNIAFSAQVEQTSSSGVINVWLRKNGVDVPVTNTKLNVAANNPYVVAAWNFFVNASANDYYEIVWSSDSANTILESATYSGHPQIPSVILTVNQVG